MSRMKDVDIKWSQYVADWCVARGLTDAESVERLRRSDLYMLACRQWWAGGSDRDVHGLLERAALSLSKGE